VPSPALATSGCWPRHGSYGPKRPPFWLSPTGPGASPSVYFANAVWLVRGVAGSPGRVLFAGREVTALSADARVRLGMTLVEGGQAMFPSLSVRDNLRLGAYPALADRAHCEQRLDDVVAITRLRDVAEC